MGNIRNIWPWMIVALISLTAIGGLVWKNAQQQGKRPAPESFLYSFYEDYLEAAQQGNNTEQVLKQYATISLLEQLNECECGLEVDPFLLTQDPIVIQSISQNFQIEVVSIEDYIYKVTLVTFDNEFFDGGHPFVILKLLPLDDIYQIDHIESALSCM